MEKSDIRPTSTTAMRTLIMIIIVGLVGVFVYALQSLPNLTKFMSVFSVGTVIAGASLLGGGTLGFLFGIPRTRLKEDNKNEEDYIPNTNIELISDWLTKIIVGVGLTQITKVPGALEEISVKLAPALGGFASSPVFSIAIILYFLLCGFLFGWLWTRLYLRGAFIESEKAEKQHDLGQMSAAFFLAEGGLKGDAKVETQKARLEVERKLASFTSDINQAQQQLIQLAIEYENVRNTMPGGPARTSKMNALIAQVRSLAILVNYKPTSIIGLFNTGSPGNRIVALGLAQARPLPVLFEIVLKGISSSESAFEQYNALRVADDMLKSLKEDQRQQLKDAIEAERQKGYISPETDRWYISERIMNAIIKMTSG